MAQRLGTWLFGGEAEETRTIAWLTSTLGILSGYSLYILWWEQEEQGKSG